MEYESYGAQGRLRGRLVGLAILLMASTGTSFGSVIVPAGKNFILVGAGDHFFQHAETTDAGVTSLSLFEEATFSIPQFDPATAGGPRLYSVTLTLVSSYELSVGSFIIDTGVVPGTTSVSVGDMEMAVRLDGEPLFSKVDDTGGTDSCTTSPSGLLPDSCEAEAAVGGDFIEQMVVAPGAPFVGSGAVDVTFRMSGDVSRDDLSSGGGAPLAGNFFDGEAIWSADLFVSYELPGPDTLMLVLLGVAGVAVSRRRHGI